MVCPDFWPPPPQSTVAKLLGARGIRSAFETCGITIALFCLSWQLAVALLVSAPLLTPVVARLSISIGAASKASQAAAAEVAAAADEVVENMRVVKLFAQQQRELSRFHALLDTAHELALKVGADSLQGRTAAGAVARMERRPGWFVPDANVSPASLALAPPPPPTPLYRVQVLRLQALLDGSSRVRNTLCVLATLSLGSWMALHSAVSLGTLYSFFVFSFSFAFALGNLTTTVGDMAKAAGAISRAMGTMQQALGTASAEEAAAALSSADEVDGALPWLGVGAAARPQRRLPEGWQPGIEFRDVSFSHPGWQGWTIQGLSFSIPAGKTVALVGPRCAALEARPSLPLVMAAVKRSSPTLHRTCIHTTPRVCSGGGKSTIASLLMGLYEPGRGDVLVDGVPLSQLDKQVCWVGIAHRAQRPLRCSRGWQHGLPWPAFLTPLAPAPPPTLESAVVAAPAGRRHAGAGAAHRPRGRHHPVRPPRRLRGGG